MRVVSTEFLLTTLVIVATPGTGVLYTLAAGLARGARASIVAAVACTLGTVPHMLAAITFVSSGASHATLRMLELSAVFMAATFVVFALYGVLAAAVRTHVLSRPPVVTWMRRFFGGAFLALAGRLALAER